MAVTVKKIVIWRKDIAHQLDLWEQVYLSARSP